MTTTSQIPPDPYCKAVCNYGLNQLTKTLQKIGDTTEMYVAKVQGNNLAVDLKNTCMCQIHRKKIAVILAREYRDTMTKPQRQMRIIAMIIPMVEKLGPKLHAELLNQQVLWHKYIFKETKQLTPGMEKQTPAPTLQQFLDKLAVPPSKKLKM